MKLHLLTSAFAAVMGLALASLPLTTYAASDSNSSSGTGSGSSSGSTNARGTITAVDTSANTISIENKTDGTRTFSISSTATFTKDKKPATLSDFAVGDKVSITYQTDSSGTMTATKIISGGAGGGKKSKKSSSGGSSDSSSGSSS
ncbi:MAG TPA: DUF5666 domain-containing protein [Candidatus Methylacidiphilales bacterium]|nr:DUF5666 domain-containing protein [Candidatus Methylacidiphilales bacterium]